MIAPQARLEPKRFHSTAAMLKAWRPTEPVYCLFPERFRHAVKRFVEGFPGLTIYAVKANPLADVVRHIHAAGVHGFDTASIPEIALIQDLAPGSACYYMAPARLLGAAEQAYRRYRVRHYAVDCDDEIATLAGIVEARARDEVTLYVRLATPGTSAMFELSGKFGVTPEEGARLLDRLGELGFRAALTFHVGSQCLDPEAYAHALDSVKKTLSLARAKIAALDVGGGFATPYPGLEVRPLADYFAAIARMKEALALPAALPLLCEPGRALCAEGMSLVTQVILRKNGRLHINDGVYGSFMEAKLPGSSIHYPVRSFRRAPSGEIVALDGETSAFTLYGPSCDSYDVLPKAYLLPRDIMAGDWIEFGLIGAYSAAMRTQFNGFYAETVVEIEADAPPGP
jgi:ornithine decarboxylase